MQTGPDTLLAPRKKRRYTVGQAGPNTGGNCRQEQPDVATNTIAVRHSRSPARRRSPPCGRLTTVSPAPPAETTVATLKSWRLLRNLWRSITRIIGLVQAILILHLASSE